MHEESKECILTKVFPLIKCTLHHCIVLSSLPSMKYMAKRSFTFPQESKECTLTKVFPLIKCTFHHCIGLSSLPFMKYMAKRSFSFLQYQHGMNSGRGGEEDISIHISQPQSVKIEQYIHHLETEGITRVKMYIVITTAYLIFWAPLFLVGFLKCFFLTRTKLIHVYLCT